MAGGLTYAGWMERLGTEKLAGIAENIWIAKLSDADKVERWFNRYVKFCARHDLEVLSTIDEVDGYHAAAAAADLADEDE